MISFQVNKIYHKIGIFEWGYSQKVMHLGVYSIQNYLESPGTIYHSKEDQNFELLYFKLYYIFVVRAICTYIYSEI